MKYPSRANLLLLTSTARRSARSRCGAFTLLELLVALAMAAIIAGSLYSGLRVGFRARASAEASIEPIRTAELATSVLRADFESARATTGTLSGPFVGTDNTGNDGLATDSVVFFTLGNPTDPVTNMAAASAAGSRAGPAAMAGMAAGGAEPVSAGEARKVEIGLKSYPGPNGVSEQDLVRLVTTNLLSQVELEPYEEVLCRNVRALNIRYFDGTTWQDSWDSTQLDNNIPCAVELTLELERTLDGQTRVIQFPRVFLLSCSTLSATSTSTSGSSGATGGTTP